MPARLSNTFSVYALRYLQTNEFNATHGWMLWMYLVLYTDTDTPASLDSIPWKDTEVSFTTTDNHRLQISIVDFAEMFKRFSKVPSATFEADVGEEERRELLQWSNYNTIDKWKSFNYTGERVYIYPSAIEGTGDEQHQKRQNIIRSFLQFVASATNNVINKRDAEVLVGQFENAGFDLTQLREIAKRPQERVGGNGGGSVRRTDAAHVSSSSSSSSAPPPAHLEDSDSDSDDDPKELHDRVVQPVAQQATVKDMQLVIAQWLGEFKKMKNSNTCTLNYLPNYQTCTTLVAAVQALGVDTDLAKKLQTCLNEQLVRVNHNVKNNTMPEFFSNRDDSDNNPKLSLAGARILLQLVVALVTIMGNAKLQSNISPYVTAINMCVRNSTENTDDNAVSEPVLPEKIQELSTYRQKQPTSKAELVAFNDNTNMRTLVTNLLKKIFAVNVVFVAQFETALIKCFKTTLKTIAKRSNTHSDEYISNKILTQLSSEADNVFERLGPQPANTAVLVARYATLKIDELDNKQVFIKNVLTYIHHTLTQSSDGISVRVPRYNSNEITLFEQNGMQSTTNTLQGDHLKYKTAAELLMGKAQGVYLTSLGYVVRYICALAGVAACLGQFADTYQIDMQLQEQIQGNICEVQFDLHVVDPHEVNVKVNDARLSCKEHHKMYAERNNQRLAFDLPFVMKLTGNVSWINGENKYYLACRQNIPLQMVPGYVPALASSDKKADWLSKIGFGDMVLYLAQELELPTNLVCPNDSADLKIDYDMMDIKPFSCHFEALPLFAAHYKTMTDQYRQQNALSTKESKTDRLMKQIMMWCFTGNASMPRTNRTLTGGGQYDGLQDLQFDAAITEGHDSDIGTYSFRQYELNQNFCYNTSRKILALMHWLVGLGIPAQTAIYVLDMYRTFSQPNKKSDFATQFKQIDQAKITKNPTNIVKGLNLYENMFSRSDMSTNQPGQTNQTNQNSQTNQTGQSGQANTDLLSRLAKYGMDFAYKQHQAMAQQANNDESRAQHQMVVTAIENGLKNEFQTGRTNRYAWEGVFASHPRFAKIEGRWYDTRVLGQQNNPNHNPNQQHNPNNPNQHTNQGNVLYTTGNNSNHLGGALAVTGAAGAAAAINMAYNNTNAQNNQVSVKANMISDQADRQARKVARLATAKVNSSARNITITDAQGRAVFTLLPHNILANIMLFVFGGLTVFAAAAGTSTYSALIDVAKAQASQMTENLAPIQPARMACSFFFGLGIGILMAFLVSLVEIINNKRVRQALFIIMMSVPVIVLGAMGIYGAATVCAQNVDTPSQPTGYQTGSTKSMSSMSAPAAPTVPGVSKMSSFGKSLLGLHDSDLLTDVPTCGKDAKCTNNATVSCTSNADCTDDVQRDNIKASDFMFIGMGVGVLVAGLCTIMPDNPFNPNEIDTQFGLAKQANFTAASSLSKHWLIYVVLFSCILIGSGASTLWLSYNDNVTITKNNLSNTDVRDSGRVQAWVAIGLAVVIAVALGLGGSLHRRKQEEIAKLMADGGLNLTQQNGQTTVNYNNTGQNTNTTSGHNTLSNNNLTTGTLPTGHGNQPNQPNQHNQPNQNKHKK